jgi:predicted PurR-regulated permease PerM
VSERTLRQAFFSTLGLLALVVVCVSAIVITSIVVSAQPFIRYLDTTTVIMNGWPVQWDVRLEVSGEEVKAAVYSEREAIRLRDATRR